MGEQMRKLEIGPSSRHLRGYETIGMEYSTVKADVSKPLPYEDCLFDEVLASHVIEHIEWYRTQEVLTEWSRILKPNGVLKIWTPDFKQIIDIVLKAEADEPVTSENVEAHSVWMKKLNKDNNPYIWANYRIYSVDSDKTQIKYNRTHSCMFTFKSLKRQMESAGLTQIKRLDETPPYAHGWTNMGVQGVKGERA
jgi:ubiquinone/menaquinone biosynthesis C-methylase UbiE